MSATSTRPNVSSPKPTITFAQRTQFEEEGWFILESVVEPAEVEALRETVDAEIDHIHEEMDRQNSDTLGGNHRDQRYFIGYGAERRKALHDYVYGPVMAEICRATLGDEAQFFYDQFVIKAGQKGARPGMKFGWHQDAGYIDHAHPFYLTCWTALDDMSEENGTVRLLPYSRGVGKRAVEHTVEEGSNDRVGYFGDDPGDAAVVPVGSVVVFSSLVFHCSGTNRVPRMRRSYLTQYSREPILSPDGSRPHMRAEPFLVGGEVVAKPFTGG